MIHVKDNALYCLYIILNINIKKGGKDMSDASSAVVRIILTQIIAIVGGLIFGAIAHFLLGDWGIAIFIVYILLGFASGGPTLTDIRSAAVLFITSIISSILVFLIMSKLLVIVFGPAFTYLTTIAGLSPTITGILITIVLGLISTTMVKFLNDV